MLTLFWHQSASDGLLTLAPIFDLAQIGTDVRDHTVGAARDESRGLSYMGSAYNWNGCGPGRQRA